MPLIKTAAALSALAVVATPLKISPAPRDPWAGSGTLPAQSCREPALISGGVARPQEYLRAMVKCLDKAWNGHFAKARKPFSKPKVVYFDAPQDRICGLPWPEGIAAFYCTARRTLVFPLTGDWIEGRTDLLPLKVAAHEYGHHLQTLTGIRAAYERGRATAERGRRYELQADCLSGVFLGAAWKSLPRAAKDWAALLETVKASGDDTYRTHGTGASRVYWLTRGYTTAKPASCDTWSAPASRVS
ncbi:neutral zinc metallopeptidase [Nonomuraea typhae]|uniref:neutral zinc metallopeptidase n=1 Tax=Nonomuraea typhae TaxID=2603600 RepID=UPI001FE58A70|nr:neutral zinc metallopeptidase [Nonomuraea typhae]